MWRAGVDGLALYDVAAIDAPVRDGGVTLDPPAGFRCQHLARSDGAAVIATHHGDETGDGWVALVDATDPAAPVAVGAWREPGVEPEGVAFVGEVALVAAHESGVLRFDVSGGVLGPPETLADDVGNAYAVAVDLAGRIAVGTVEGDVLLLDAAVLADGSVIVADWNDLRVLDGVPLALLGTESPASPGAAVALLGVDRHEDDVFVAGWQGLRTYTWDPAVTVSRTTMELAAGGADFVELGWVSTGGGLSATLTLTSDDPDQPEVQIPVAANRPTVGVGDVVPEFSYVAFNGAETWSSRDLGGPALLTYFATF